MLSIVLLFCAVFTLAYPDIEVVSESGSFAVPVHGAAKETVVKGRPSAAKLAARRDRAAKVYPAVKADGLRAQASVLDGALKSYELVLFSLRNTSDRPIRIDTIHFLKDWSPVSPADGVRSGNTDGSVALFPKGRFFVGVEHPMAKLDVKNGRVSAELPRQFAIEPGETWRISYVVGQYTGDSARRDFQRYLECERAHPYRVLPHYNSWYDINIGRNDRPWQQRMNEAECLGVMRAFRKEMGDRGVFIDSYLWDDGWDSWDSLWDFHPGFPNGFAKLADEAHQVKGASIGCWMSPCGGYGGSQARRVAYAKAKGIIGPNEGMLRMASPTYYAAFRDRVLDMIRKYDMNIFKFDRMGNGFDATGCDVKKAPEMDAIVRLIGEMRKAKPDVFINCTVGTWASPFWVMYADSIWRGAGDFGTAGTGTARQQWLTYRDNQIYDRFVRPCPLFPLNSMMMHGIIVCKHNDGCPPEVMDVSDSPQSTQDFADEVWMGVACGTDLQEYYITPKLMHRSWWDILAKGVKWLKANESNLRDVHWVGSDPLDGDKKTGHIYGYASAGKSRGTLILRNAADTPQTFESSVADILDLPEKLRKVNIKKQTTVYSHDAEVNRAKTAADTLKATLQPHAVILLEFIW